MAQLGADAKNLLTGKPLGFMTDIGNGAKMELVEIYEFIQKAPVAVEAAPVPTAAVVENGATAAEVAVVPSEPTSN